jgi:hypothetical protein
MVGNEYRECSQKDLLMLGAHERVRKNMKIFHLEKK